MSEPGHQMMQALTDVRQLLRELHALLAEITRTLDLQGWTRATRSTKGSNQLSTSYDSPDAWMPRYLFRWFHHPRAHPGVYLVFVVQLERIDGHPPEPWVVAGAYVYDHAPWDLIPDRDANADAAGLHVEEENGLADGVALRTSFDGGCRWSLAVPLLSIGSAEELHRRVVMPILQTLTTPASPEVP